MIIRKEVAIIKNKIKEYRNKLGCSQEELARKLTITRQTMNSIENGKTNPNIELCIKIAKILKTDLDTIFWIK